MYKPRLAALWGSCVPNWEMILFYPSLVARLALVTRNACVIAVISLATALVSTFHSQPAELELTTGMPSVICWICMGCQQPNRHRDWATGPGSYSSFVDYKSAACHYARSPACSKSNRGLFTVTIVSRPSDRVACGGGAAGAWTFHKGTI